MDKLEMKKCHGECKKEYPNTLEFFYKKGDKLRNICKECDKKKRNCKKIF